jgi:hypothetical protein
MPRLGLESLGRGGQHVTETATAGVLRHTRALSPPQTSYSKTLTATLYAPTLARNFI